MNKISWMQQQRRPTIESFYGDPGDKPVYYGVDSLGLESVTEYPAYSNGDFAVIDVVKDLDWLVLDLSNFYPMRKTMDKYEAIRWADEYKELKNE